MVVVRHHIAKNGSTSLVHRQDYGIISVSVQYTIEAADPSIMERYRCSTDINKAIPEYCHCSSVARSGSASAETFKHVQKLYCRLPLLILLPMFCRCPADVLPFLPMWYRCAAVLVPIPENRQICAPVLLRRAKSVRCDSALRKSWL